MSFVVVAVEGQGAGGGGGGATSLSSCLLLYTMTVAHHQPKYLNPAFMRTTL